MNLKEAVEFFGNQSNLAKAIGIARQAITKWKAYGIDIPIKYQIIIQAISRNKLKATYKTARGINLKIMEVIEDDKESLKNVTNIHRG